MSQAERQAGFKVALAGTGGDELFGGYASFRSLPTMLRWSKRTKWVPQTVVLESAKLIALMLQPSRGTIPPQTRWAKLPEMVQHGRNLLSLYQIAYALFLPDFQRQLTEGLLANNVVDGLPEEMRTRLQIEMRCRSVCGGGGRVGGGPAA
jgi:asparagine synthase (glutamine-hydrolysing)